MPKSYHGGIPFVRKYAPASGSVKHVPERIIISLKNGSECSLNEGDTVRKYGKILDKTDSSPALFAGVGGKIESISRIGVRADITLLTDAEAEVEAPFDAPEKSITELTEDELCSLLLERGISPLKKGKRNPRTLTVDCGGSPYNDSRLYVCRAHPQEVILGAKIIMKLLGARTCRFALPASDVVAAEKLYESFPQSGKMFKIELMKDQLPVNIPNLTVSALYSVEVSAVKSVFDAGYPVVSPLTCLSYYRALVEGIPYCESYLSLGEMNGEVDILRVPFGAPLLPIAAPSKDETVIHGEGLYGTEITDEVMSADVEAITVLIRKEEKDIPTRPCIECGRCADICPAFLSPVDIFSSAKDGKISDKLALYASACFGCHACSYICPSLIPLAETVIAIHREKGVLSVEIDGDDPDFYEDNTPKGEEK